MINTARSLTASALSLLPNFRGRGRISWAANRTFLAMGADPIISVPVNGVHMQVDLRTLTEFIAFWHKSYDATQIRSLSKLLNRMASPVFVDVGANIGFYSVAIANALKKSGGRVYCFEPHPGNYERLKANLAANALVNAFASNVGLSSNKVTLNLVMRGDFKLGSNTGNCSIEIPDSRDDKARKVPVRLETFDSFVGEQNVAQIDVIKIDVEGHEDQVLRGATSTLMAHRPIIQMEVNRWFFERKEVDFDVAIVELLPPEYVIFRYEGEQIKKVSSLSKCKNFTDVLLCPVEKAAWLESLA